jgi:hypothetical protein
MWSFLEAKINKQASYHLGGTQTITEVRSQQGKITTERDRTNSQHGAQNHSTACLLTPDVPLQRYKRIRLAVLREGGVVSKQSCRHVLKSEDFEPSHAATPRQPEASSQYWRHARRTFKWDGKREEPPGNRNQGSDYWMRTCTRLHCQGSISAVSFQILIKNRTRGHLHSKDILISNWN